MGACASVPKAMRGKDAAAPEPEPLKEEIPTAEVAKAEVEVEKKAEDYENPSLEKLIAEGEASKEAPKEEETSSKSKTEEVLPASETSAKTEEEKSASSPPPAQLEAAATEEKKIETTEQK